MSAQFWPVTETFAAEVGDVDLSQPLPAEDVAAIREAFDRYGGTADRERQMEQLLKAGEI